MTKLIILIPTFILFSNWSFSQQNVKYKPDLILNLCGGIELKNNNQRQMKIDNAVPVIKFSIGDHLLKKYYYTTSISYSHIKEDGIDKFVEYDKTEIMIGFGIEAVKNKTIIRQQLSFGSNNYTAVTIFKNEPINGFNYMGNKLSSKNNRSIKYIVDFISLKAKEINYLGGLSISYLLKNDFMLTNEVSNRFFVQLYCGLDLNF
ncbi:MAG: hypothetical protein H6605_03695 [Flavobacteriales bacterium]|nr:hypothetical protein [Flavobacteriales bacterium]